VLSGRLTVVFIIIILLAPIGPCTYVVIEPYQRHTDTYWKLKNENIFPSSYLSQVVSIPENRHVVYEREAGIPLEAKVYSKEQSAPFSNSLPTYTKEGTNVKIEFDITFFLKGDIYITIINKRPVKEGAITVSPTQSVLRI